MTKEKFLSRKNLRTLVCLLHNSKPFLLSLQCPKDNTNRFVSININIHKCSETTLIDLLFQQIYLEKSQQK